MMLIKHQQTTNKERKQLNITILSVDIKTVPTAKGSYQVADIAYKNNTFQGKVEGKKVMSFGATANAFKVLAESAPQDTFEVTIVKNDKGYNDWTALTKADAGAPSTISAPTASKTTVPTKTTYETAEERAQRQVLIVRQSSVSSAVAMLVAGAKTPPTIDAVLGAAKAFEAYVFGETASPEQDFNPAGFPDVE
jgi:hypothetical protein